MWPGGLTFQSYFLWPTAQQDDSSNPGNKIPNIEVSAQIFNELQNKTMKAGKVQAKELSYQKNEWLLKCRGRFYFATANVQEWLGLAVQIFFFFPCNRIGGADVCIKSNYTGIYK